MFWEKKLKQWVQDVRDRANLPARLVLWDGQQHDFGSFAAPQVTLHVKSATALRYLLEPTLDNLGEAYIKGKIDIEGKLSDIINVSYSLAKSTVTSASKLARVRRYFTHSKATDRKAIQYHYDVSNEFYELWLDREHGLFVRVLRERRRRPRHRAVEEDRPHPHEDPVAARPAPARHRLRLGRARDSRGAEVRRAVRRRHAVAEPVRSRDQAREGRRPRRPGRDPAAGLSRHRRPVRPHHERRHVRARRAQEPAGVLPAGSTICSPTTASR